jgi:CheY-like chemotaxis protein/HPt (histidine-containing phosphotransfer) domain-containing protein
MCTVNKVPSCPDAEDGFMRIESRPLDLAGVISSTVAEFMPLATDKGLRLAVQHDPRLPAQVLGDAVRLSRIVGNYIGNAIKFTDTGGVTVCTHLLSLHSRGARIRVEVRDSGAGIAASRQRQLFQPLRERGGMGLGLAICRQLADLMGGAVGVDSAPGIGSLFWFEAWLAREEGSARLAGEAKEVNKHGGMRNGMQESREQASANDSEEAAIQLAMAQLRGARLLLAEDNPLNRELVRLLVGGTGAALTSVANGQEALDVLAAAGGGVQPYHCVLMDIQMPVMDGREAVRRMREDPRLEALPVVAIAANATQEERDLCAAAGMNDFLAKPIEPAVFYSTLARWVTGARQAEASVAASAGAAGGLESLSVLAALVDNDPDTMGRLASIFFDNAAAALVAAGQLVESGDMAALRPLAQRLKASARAVGALRFADLCMSLERAGSADEGQALLGELRPALALMAAEAGRAGTQHNESGGYMPFMQR